MFTNRPGTFSTWGCKPAGKVVERAYRLLQQNDFAAPTIFFSTIVRPLQCAAKLVYLLAIKPQAYLEWLAMQLQTRSKG
ncbi:hypothetical protein PTKIN_Ptkin03bG0059700 [Pterospermum kingtungense]